MTDRELAALLPPILPDAHKYTRGSLLVLAGSTRFPGAAVLAAKAAARAGAGYVTLAIPKPAVAAAQAHLLATPVLAAPATNGAFAADAWDALCDQLNHLDAIVLGPGLTVTPSTSAFVQSVLQSARVPLLLDADALTLLAALPTAQAAPALLPPLILTPHAGELARLLDATGATDPKQLAEALNAVVVAKGPETHIVSPTQHHRFTGGTAALATAGTGDVLSGIIGSLLAQGASPYAAAVLGVELHGRAGRLAEEQLGQRSVRAEDLLETLPLVFKKLEAHN
jgi:NAD(P)H-hydrate epimerase